MKVSVIGGGSWGSTLANLLSDNGHKTLIYDRNPLSVENINKYHLHPFFANTYLNEDVLATSSLDEALAYADYYLIAVPSGAIREIFKTINAKINSKKFFINVAKGIEPETLKTVSEIFVEEVDKKKTMGFVTLSGPSHAEEVILRKLTLLVAASNELDDAIVVQNMFSNSTYIRVYTSTDLKGVEVGGSIKNAIALISGVLTGLGLGENARAALISRGIYEIVKITEAMGGKKDTVFGLSGIGDLIVTASSTNSRNFNAGVKIGQGATLEEALSSSKMVVEGARVITSGHQIAKKYNLDLPIIETAYLVLYRGVSAKDGISNLMNRQLKSE